ncbi:MAG: TRAP transporter large permease subunit [Kiritimatiellaceae bacterium]|nr:TRAP transporter large permease subunit [Kiritimatiellaceae bacterium]
MTKEWISLAVFILCYVLFVFLPGKRSWVACAGGALLVATGVLTWSDALFTKISWNVMGLFFGTLILAEIFMMSRVPAVMAEWLVDKAKSTRVAMLVLCALAGVISMFVENVAVVLLLAPVALSLADKLKVSPVPLLIGIAVSSNLQGTATMIGDPPSMILAGYMKMGFWDFFAYEGRPGIFFAVQIGAIASLLVLAWLFRSHRTKSVLLAQETARSWVPASLLGLLVIGLSFATLFDPEFKWFAGTYTLILGAVALIWFRGIARWGSLRKLAKTLDWDTTFFLIGIFVLVGGLSDSGWMDKLATGMSGWVGSNVALAFTVIVLFSVLVSGFVDNVPFLLVMIPVAQKVADQIGAPVPLLMFGLLIGACLGGNLTPIGASANVVTLGILKKHGYQVGFKEFMRIGIPFTVAAVVSACAFVWWVWGV